MAGHLFANGKQGGIVDDRGKFYKALQRGPRGEREVAFYEHAWPQLSGAGPGPGPGPGPAPALVGLVPRYFGQKSIMGNVYIELEDVTRDYRQPSIIDIKVGFRTWYDSADEVYIERCKQKDASSTIAALGFKICGMQVYQKSRDEYARASKQWCKRHLTGPESVREALRTFARNGAGLHERNLYGGAGGFLRILEEIEDVFKGQRDYHFYSSSVLLIYEGTATTPEDANLSVKLIDFAHALEADGSRDENFLAGLRGLQDGLRAILAGPDGDEEE